MEKLLVYVECFLDIDGTIQLKLVQIDEMNVDQIDILEAFLMDVWTMVDRVLEEMP